jgi:outer membrane murein-binding lipoprotein Lpp
MNPFLRFAGLALFVALASTAPAFARPDCSSNANLWHVHRRLDGAIDQLSHDQRDYAGHRVAALNDLQNARGQIMAAEQYAVNVDHDNPACFRASGSTGGSDRHWGMRGQGGSNANIIGVRRWVERLINQLQSDQRDYGGHRVAAIDDMQAAREQLVAAESSGRRGY